MPLPSYRARAAIHTLALVLVSGRAHAGGPRLLTPGGELGHPTTAHPSAIVHNPAGLALEGGTRLWVEAAAGFHRMTYDRPDGAIDHLLADGERAAGTPADARAANAGRASTLGIFAGPTAAALVSDMGTPHLALGASVHVPMAGSLRWDDNEAFRGSERYPGALDGVQRWWSIEAEVRGIAATVAVARRFPAAGLSIGASAGVLHLDVRTVVARGSGGTDDLLTRSGGILEGRALLEVSGIAPVLTAGAIWEPTAGLYLGAAYESRPGLGDLALEGTYTTRAGAAEVGGPTVLRQAWPDIVRGGARLVLPGLELRITAEYQRWSVVQSQCVVDATTTGPCRVTASGAADLAPGSATVLAFARRDWRDTVNVRAGTTVALGDRVALLAGAGYDGSAVPDATLDPGLHDARKLIFSGGARVKLAGTPVALTATYTHAAFFERTLAPRPRGDDGAPIAPEPPSRSPDPAGRYARSLGLVLFGLEWQLPPFAPAP